ncbi:MULTISPECIES: hypothetical protein [Paenibacillus]|uniref:DUF4330 domain-containing protein n=1 Tax=Paenibacillus borealis TaxID=160799 RepID=A0ABX3GXF1_PAEBO|nr:hypothetical protein [Paenibacillus borealis]OMD38974.1 hypothetical protein BSK56_29985 [Paenibacillus borealis]
MKWNRISVTIAVFDAVLIIALSITAATVGPDVVKLIQQFGSFTVTVDNQSDYDLFSVETGVLTSDSTGQIIESSSKESFEQGISSGTKVKISPELSLSGEGGIYLKYTDPRDESSPKTVGICSYTESLSGHSKVIITNDDVSVAENCS